MARRPGRPIGTKKHPDSPAYSEGAQALSVRLSQGLREQVLGLGGAAWVRQIIQQEIQMVEFRVMSHNGTDGKGSWAGLGLQKFRVPPREGDFIGVEDAANIAQVYQVVALLHPLEPTSTAGELIVKYFGTDVAFRKKLAENSDATLSSATCASLYEDAEISLQGHWLAERICEAQAPFENVTHHSAYPLEIAKAYVDALKRTLKIGFKHNYGGELTSRMRQRVALEILQPMYFKALEARLQSTEHNCVSLRQSWRMLVDELGSELIGSGA